MALMNKLQTPRFYVYQYHDPRPGKNQAVIYVGKGTHRGGKLARMESHWSSNELKNPVFDRVLSKIRGLGLAPVRVVVSWHETERDAFAAEVLNIALHGLRRDGGTLCNLTYGGEGATGMIHSDDAVQKIRTASQNFWQDPNYVAKRDAAVRRYYAAHPDEVAARNEKTKLAWTAEKRKEQSDGVKARGPEFGAKIRETIVTDESRMLRQAEIARTALQSEDVIARRKATLKQTMSTAEFRQELSARTKAALAKPEAKANQKAAAKALWADPEHREKMLAARAQQVTDETRAKLSASTKQAVANQSAETKAKLSEFRREMARARHARTRLEKINALDLGTLAALCG